LQCAHMEEGLIRLVIMIGTPLSLAGGLTAFLITYESWMRGKNPDKRLGFRIALKTALVALAVFIVISIAIGFVLIKIIAK
jgi:hypothetical protein